MWSGLWKQYQCFNSVHRPTPTWPQPTLLAMCPVTPPHPNANLQGTGSFYPNTTPDSHAALLLEESFLLTLPHLQAPVWENPTHPLREQTCSLLCEAFPTLENETWCASRLPGNSLLTSAAFTTLHYNCSFTYKSPQARPANLRGGGTFGSSHFYQQPGQGPTHARNSMSASCLLTQ